MVPTLVENSKILMQVNHTPNFAATDHNSGIAVLTSKLFHWYNYVIASWLVPQEVKDKNDFQYKSGRKGHHIGQISNGTI